MTERECTCHPDEAPRPCQHRYALTACYAARTRQLEGENKALVLQNAMLRQRPDLPVDRLPAAREYEEEIARLRRCLAKQPNTYMIAYEDGKHQRLARALCEANDECDRFRLKIERLRAALEEIKSLGVQKKGGVSYAMASIARAALEGQ